jgi:hypothetical protein
VQITRAAIFTFAARCYDGFVRGDIGMRRIAGIFVIGAALFLAGCEDVDFGVFGDDDAPVATAPTNSLQAGQFCQNRGYQPGSDGYARCLVSVNENLHRNTGSMAAPGPYPQ